MRCKNCGWDNAPGASRCEKCNAPLTGSMGEGASQYRQEPESPLKSTVRENNVFEENCTSSQECKKCGYPLANGMNVCPQCGTPIKIGSQQRNDSHTEKCPKCGTPIQPGTKFCSNCGYRMNNPLTGTVRSWDGMSDENSYCTLRPIAWSKENIQYNPITYSGETIILNRSNTDPNNQSITSKEQAILICENDKWYIEDRSALQSTFIQVRRRTQLQSGDIIVLGNRQFEFKG